VSTEQGEPISLVPQPLTSDRSRSARDPCSGGPARGLATVRELLAVESLRLTREVNERFHTPVFALVVVGLGSIAALIVYATNADFTTLTGIVAFIFSFIIVSIAAIAFPYRKPAAWAASPVSWRWGGLPVISIVGALSLASLLVMLWVFFNDPLSGVNVLDGFSLKLTGADGSLTKDAVRLLITAVTIVSGLVVFELARIRQARRGVRLEAAYEEIPVE